MKNIIQATLMTGLLSFSVGSLAQSQISRPATSNTTTSTNSNTVSGPATGNATRNQQTLGTANAPSPATANSSVETSSPTPTNGLPMAIPSQVDPNRNTSLDETQRRTSRTFQNLEVCRDDDAGCIRRRNEQMRRNTPFQQQTPPAPGVTPPSDNTNSNIRQ